VVQPVVQPVVQEDPRSAEAADHSACLLGQPTPAAVSSPAVERHPQAAHPQTSPPEPSS
jgi:hypothetical protein